MISRLALTVALCLCVAAASAQVQTMDDVSFAVPDGWEYSFHPGENHSTLSFGQNGNIWAIAVFKPLRFSGNADADFRTAWIQDVKSMAVPEPIYEYKGFAGYSGRYASTNTGDGSHYVYLCVLETGQTAVPVLVIAGNRQLFNAQEPVILQFIEGVRTAPAKARPVNKNISIADLVGEWRSGGESSVNYVNSVTGSYAGSSTVVHGASYVIAPNGSFTYQFTGLSNRQISREQGSGTVELALGFIIFHEKTKNRSTRYHFISYQWGVDGSTVLTLLGENYQPDAASISFYGEKWVRPAPKK